MPFCSGTHLGSTAARAFVPSMPISLFCRFSVFNGALKNPTESGKTKS